MSRSCSIKLAVNEKSHVWRDDFVIPPKTSEITFDAVSYQAWADALVPELSAVCPYVDDAREQTAAKNGRWLTDVKKYIPVGDQHILFLIQIPTFTLWNSFAPWHNQICSNSGKADKPVYERMRLPVHLTAKRVVAVGFTNVVYVPVLSEILPTYRWTDGKNELRPWMSLTPLEVFTLRPLVRRAKGKVGIAGIGMGWCARQILKRKTVSHVTIVEKNAAILEYFGSRLLAEYGEHRVTLVHGDAYSHNWHSYDVSLWDIWPAIGDAAWDKNFLAICDSLRNAGRVCEGWTQRGGYGPKGYR